MWFLSPSRSVYYFFASTISASVARADIATHANFHVVGGATGHSPRVGSDNAFPTTPAPVASDIFFFDEDVASGLDWKDTDGTTDLTAATAGDMARYDGTDWIKVINVVGSGGGGGGGGDRIVLADAVGVSNTAGPHEIALDSAMTAGNLLTFYVLTSAAANPDGIGYLLSDDILALTAEATTPTDAGNALSVVTASYSASSFSQQSGNYFVYRKDDSTLWIRPTRLAAHTLTITATPLGGGGTAGQQASSGLTRTAILTPPAPALPLTNTELGTALTTGTPSQIGFTEVHKDNFHSIELQVAVGEQYVHDITITKEALGYVGPSPGRPDTIDDYTVRSLAFYTSGRQVIGSDSREPQILNPTWAYADFRRLANRYGVFVWVDDNTAGTHWRTIYIFCSANDDCELVSGGVYHF